MSQQLRILRDAALVTERHVGTRHYFALDAATLAEMRAYLDLLWHDALAAFARHVERQEKARGR